jgi:hypothetical protein
MKENTKQINIVNPLAFSTKYHSNYKTEEDEKFINQSSFSAMRGPIRTGKKKAPIKSCEKVFKSEAINSTDCPLSAVYTTAVHQKTF